MDTIVDTIRAAVAERASEEAKQAGATACRAVLAALEGQAGAPLAPPPSPPAAPALASSIATAVGALRSVPPDQILDLVIDRLRNAATARGVALSPSPTPLAFRVQHLPVPQVRKEPGKP